MHLHISTADGVPIYLQIVRQVKHLIAAGKLAGGSEIPAIRTLAQQLLINPNTVARAYLELEKDGVVIKRHGSGTYISGDVSPLARRERVKRLTERADALIAEAHQMGIDLEEIVRLLSQRYESLKSH